MFARRVALIVFVATIAKSTSYRRASSCEEVPVEALESAVSNVVLATTQVTGFGVSVGYVDACGRSFAVADGPRDPTNRTSPIPSGNARPTDRFTFGSGTKGLTATAVMRLVDRGVLRTDDPAHVYADRTLLRDFNTTLEEILGSRALNVTVGQLIQMRSGISDFDVPDFDNYVLENAAGHTFTPMDILSYVSSLKDQVCEADYSGVCSCRFQFEPGTMVAYSSTNFVIAGLVLVGASSPATTWSDYDLATQGLNLDPKRSSFSFVSEGPLSRWLDVAGDSIQYGRERLYDQDASVLGWTCGNAIATTLDMARFYYDLLGPPCSFVSSETRTFMMQFRTLSEGWAKGYIDYGTGLMIQNMAPAQSIRGQRPSLNQSASYVGHAGDTYGFLSDNGYYPVLNASISVAVNQDTVPSSYFSCLVLQEILRVLDGDDAAEDLGCKPIPDEAHYVCEETMGGKMCVESVHRKDNSTLAECEATCV